MRRSKKKDFSKVIKKQNKSWFHRLVSGAFLEPSVLGVLLFFVLPFLVVIYFSFVNNPVAKKFVGLTNYINVIQNGAFRTANGNTLFFSVVAVPLAVILGMVLGFLIAIVRATHDKNGKLGVLNFFAKVYLTVIRGTPVVVQLLILYFIIFATVNIDKTLVAILAFGLNSAAYVAEIVRSGIMSIDNGQFEAGASLGLNYSKTMLCIILPQAFKNILPALANECIVLLKETSVAGYIALVDLTKGGDIIRSQTYEALLPLIAVAIIYLVMVMFLSAMVSKLERRLAKSDRG